MLVLFDRRPRFLECKCLARVLGFVWKGPLFGELAVPEAAALRVGSDQGPVCLCALLAAALPVLTAQTCVTVSLLDPRPFPTLTSRLCCMCRTCVTVSLLDPCPFPTLWSRW